jgi:hypothetical protein
MTVKDALEVAASVIAGLGGGGAIVFALSGYLGKVWAERALEEQRQKYAQLNIDFSHQLDLASRRVQMELDTLGLLHKLRTESEFQKIRYMWKKIAHLRHEFTGLPKRGLELVSSDPQTQHDGSVRASKRFVERWIKAYEFWGAESLSIPKPISDAVAVLLDIANPEMLTAIEYPDPFDKSSMAMFGPDELRQLFDDRARRLKEFMAGSLALETMMRKYLSGPS